MKHLLIGGGFTSVILAILIKKKYNKDEVIIVDKNPELLKKLSITGNGKCNILNKNPLGGLIFENEKTKSLFQKYNFDTLKEFYNSIGLPLIEKDGLFYPYSESANQVRDFLINLLNVLNVEIISNTKIIDYKKVENCYEFITDNGKITADRGYFCTGGKSYAVLGADDSLLSIFKKHGYTVNDFKPALCALKVNEDLKRLDGVRTRAKISLYDKGKVVFEESGEVLFKKDGLSGIVIFNTSLYISKNYNSFKDLKININLLHDLDKENLCKFEKYPGTAEFLSILCNKKLVNYLTFNKKLSDKSVVEILSNILFTPKAFYGFENAQISVGGISLSNLDDHLESKIEKGISFAGELLDISGYCGGYNLSMCLMSALLIFEGLN